MKNEIELGDEYYEFSEEEEAFLKDTDGYDKYRDDWSESLLSDIKKLHAKYVDDKNGYYFDASERFVEHAILCLADVAGVQLLPELGGRVGAKKYQIPRVEFVESFDELKPDEVTKNEVQINPRT